MKRQTFYIRADLFEVRISPRAKLILAYLFRVSDRQGRSHPSVSTVAYRCGCCPNSARKALHELEGAGLVAVTPNSLPTRRGNRVHAANTYTLLFLTSQDAGAPLHGLKGGTPRDAGLRYDRDFTIDVPYGHSPSVSDRTDPDPDRRGPKPPYLSPKGPFSQLFTTLLRLVHDHVAVCPNMAGRMLTMKGVHIMKRTCIIILFAIVLCTACQPTPKTEVIPNKGDDTLQAVIRENGEGFDAAAYKTGLPERWEELLDVGNGAVTVTANGPVTFPAVDRVPIWETVPGGVDLDAVEKLVQALVPGGYLSRIPVDEFGSAVWTKDRIQAEMEQNRWRMDHARELQPDASQKELDIYLRDLEAANQELMRQYQEASDETPQPIKDLSTLQEEGFQGDLGLFDREGRRVAEMTLVFDGTGRQREQVHLRAMSGGVGEMTVSSKEEAAVWARSLLDALGYGNRYGLQKAYESSATITLIFGPLVDGIEYLSGCEEENEFDWATFAPEESFEVTMDKAVKKLCVLSWVGRSELLRPMTEDTALLPFPEVQALVQNDLRFLMSWTNENIRSRQVNIQELRFGYKRIRTPNEQSWLLVPAWAVVGTVTDSGFSTDLDTGDIIAYTNKTKEGALLIFNAADGTLIGTANME